MFVEGLIAARRSSSSGVSRATRTQPPGEPAGQLVHTLTTLRSPPRTAPYLCQFHLDGDGVVAGPWPVLASHGQASLTRCPVPDPDARGFVHWRSRTIPASRLARGRAVTFRRAATILHAVAARPCPPKGARPPPLVFSWRPPPRRQPRPQPPPSSADYLRREPMAEAMPRPRRGQCRVRRHGNVGLDQPGEVGALDVVLPMRNGHGAAGRNGHFWRPSRARSGRLAIAVNDNVGGPPAVVEHDDPLVRMRHWSHPPASHPIWWPPTGRRALRCSRAWGLACAASIVPRPPLCNAVLFD